MIHAIANAYGIVIMMIFISKTRYLSGGCSEEMTGVVMNDLLTHYHTRQDDIVIYNYLSEHADKLEDHQARHAS